MKIRSISRQNSQVLSIKFLYKKILFLFTVLPDTTASDLDQHLSGLVGTPPSHNHSSTTSSLLVPRYPNNNTGDFSLSAGPRSLSDNSSQAESPVQDDLLTSNTGSNLGITHLGNTANSTNFPSLMSSHQNSTSGYPTGNCNNSLYPVLPASLLYSQLYTAANQTHNFHPLHSNSIHSAQNHHNDLQSMMDQITSTTGSHRQQHMSLNQNSGGSDLLGGSSCAAAAARGGEDGRGNGLNGQRGQQQNDGNAVVWRPY